MDMAKDDRDEKTGRFLNGNKRSTGRPRGSRSKLSEAFISDLSDAWEAHGQDALVKCATQEPATFVKIVANLLPRKVDATLEVTSAFEGYDLNDAIQFAQAYEIALRAIGAEPPPEMKTIEAQDKSVAVEVTDADDN